MGAKSFSEEYLARLNSSEGKRVREVYELVMNLLPPGGGCKVLDVGCGKGPLGMFLRSKVPDLDIVFSDIYRDKNEFLDKENFTQCSMEDMPFPDETFDSVYCMHVIAHIPDRKKAISEGMRVLKKGGKMFVFTPNKYFVWAQRAAAFLKFLPPQRYDPTAKWLFSKRSLEKLLGTNVQYFRPAPRNLPFQFLREKLVAVVEK